MMHTQRVEYGRFAMNLCNSVCFGYNLLTHFSPGLEHYFPNTA